MALKSSQVAQGKCWASQWRITSLCARHEKVERNSCHWKTQRLSEQFSVSSILVFSLTMWLSTLIFHRSCACSKYLQRRQCRRTEASDIKLAVQSEPKNITEEEEGREEISPRHLRRFQNSYNSSRYPWDIMYPRDDLWISIGYIVCYLGSTSLVANLFPSAWGPTQLGCQAFGCPRTT